MSLNLCWYTKIKYISIDELHKIQPKPKTLSRTTIFQTPIIDTNTIVYYAN